MQSSLSLPRGKVIGGFHPSFCASAVLRISLFGGDESDQCCLLGVARGRESKESTCTTIDCLGHFGRRELCKIPYAIHIEIISTMFNPLMDTPRGPDRKGQATDNLPRTLTVGDLCGHMLLYFSTNSYTCSIISITVLDQFSIVHPFFERRRVSLALLTTLVDLMVGTCNMPSLSEYSGGECFLLVDDHSLIAIEWKTLEPTPGSSRPMLQKHPTILIRRLNRIWGHHLTEFVLATKRTN
ncbi:hypothetical protein Tco_1133437 [Tanacetum coccineum]